MQVEVIQLQENISNASLTAYIPEKLTQGKQSDSRPAMIICPGGAYIGITEKEAEPVAVSFLAEGFCTFVLRYSIGADFARFPAPFLDAARAVMLVRENSLHWGINPDNISICGFSSGGQVAAVPAAGLQIDYFEKVLRADRNRFRPNAVILGYPLLNLESFRIRHVHDKQLHTLIEMIFLAAYGTSDPTLEQLVEWNIINKITPLLPPVFLWTTSEEALIGVEDCMQLVRELSKNHIPYEFHVFEKGEHGLSLGDRMAGYDEEDIKRLGNTGIWIKLAVEWLRNQFDC